MAEVTYRNENTIDRGPRTDWGAIWAGVFTFVAIWSVFGLLGIAALGRPGNPDAANPDRLDSRTSPQQNATPAQQGEAVGGDDMLQVVEELGGGGWTRTNDLRIMRPSL
jgi:hypothetical protein